MISIIYETHGTTLDNEAGISSGWFDVELSELGKKQAKEMGKRYEDKAFDVIFCSDLQRSYKTAEIAFAGQDILIIKDSRLRECNYGDLTKHSNEEVESQRVKHINVPYPNGESFEQTNARVKSFLKDLLKNHDTKKVLIIDHRATWYALEHFLNGRTLQELTTSPWHWQPGWRYELEKIN